MWTRRAFLKTGSLALYSLGVEPRFLDRVALAATEGPRPKILVSIFLRGAMDGLMAVPPLGQEKALRQFRPRLAMGGARSEADRVLDLEGQFGLHPAFSPLLPYWQDGRLAIVHGVGSPNPTRSHFDAQDYMETGTPWRKGTQSGWLNRLSERVSGHSSQFAAVSLTPELPRSLYGAYPALAISDLADLKLSRLHDHLDRAAVEEHLELLYDKGAGGALRAHGSDMFEALRVLSQQEFKAYRARRGSHYPSTRLGQSLMQIAYLIRAGVGLRVACAESDGWDTHVGQGKIGGPFALRARDLARSIAAFWSDIEPFQENVVVLTMTEFGRTVRENGSSGTDHGHGSCLFALGNQVDGGRVYGNLPTLDSEGLFEGRDLPVTTDFRAVFSEVAGKLFGLADDSEIFPGWSGPRHPLLW